MIRIGILGAAGYTGGELIRLLLNHPEAEIVFANSESNAGNLVSDVHEGLIGETDLKFTDEMLAEIEWKLNHRPRKSLGYRTPLEYCKQLFNFDF